MSGESLAHIRLVERLIAVVRERHCPPRGLLVLADHISFGADRPRAIDLYTPDVFASDLPATFEIIGEAKTPGDLETDRSKRQITAFLDYLSLLENKTFYLMVPPYSRARAQHVLKQLIQPHHHSVPMEVIDGV